MGTETEAQKQNLQLPVGVVSRVDVGRLLRELEVLENFLKAAEVREPGTTLKLPKTSKLLEEMLEINQLNALHETDRSHLSSFLKNTRMKAPTIHISFSADPSAMVTKRLVTWLRQNIHPQLLLQVGLQPTIGAGAVIRTTNKYFDLSLRERLSKNKHILIQKLSVTEAEKEQQARAQAAIEATPAAAQPSGGTAS